MRFSSLLLLAIVTTATLAQKPKGFSTLQSNSSLKEGKTYALIIGISKYKNPTIPQLQYADKDALAFYKYLTENGVDSNNIQLLLNDDAKGGDIIMGISFLIESAKAGDRVFFYFSGHGDVESKSFMRDAYLLPYDSPNKMYTSILLYQLEGYLATISAQGAEVVFICDACHSGKLAGGRNGMDAAAAALGASWKDQIKILSCSPGEVSLESSQWGNGRGLFSFELLNGCAGEADKNGDGIITLRELNLFLLEKVPYEAGTIPQNPIVLGNMQSKISKVNASTLNAIAFKNSSNNFPTIDTRGMEESILSSQPDSIRKYYSLFKSSMESGALCMHDGIKIGAFEYLEKIPANDSTRMMLGIMKRNLAAKMINEINYFTDYSLNNDGYDNYGFAIYYTYPYEKELISLIGQKKLKDLGIIPKILFMKLLYNDPVFLYPSSESMILLDSIIKMDIKATYAISLYSYLLKTKKEYAESIKYANKVIELTPSFALPYRLLAEIYLMENKLDSSLYYSQKLASIDSSISSSISLLISLNYLFLGKIDSSNYYWNEYKTSINKVKDCWNCDLVGLYASKIKIDMTKTEEKAIKDPNQEISNSKNTHLNYINWKPGDTSMAVMLHKLINFIEVNNGILKTRGEKLEENVNEASNQMYFAPAEINFSAKNYFQLAKLYASVNNQRTSLNYLEKSFASGFSDIDLIKKTNFETIWNHPYFIKLLSEYFPNYKALDER